jgi:hypothetical protein
VGKTEGKRLLRIPRHRLVDNIKMDLREIEWGSMDWTDVTEGPVEGSCEHDNELSSP